VLIRTVLLACLVSLALVACARDTSEGGSGHGHPAHPQERSVSLPSSEPSGTFGGPPVVVAAGDIANCLSGGDEATAKLLGGIHGTILTLGDEAYEHGSPGDFANCYGPTWGRYKDRTKPAPGNHEYEMPHAQGYFGYFRKAAGFPGKGYYSYNLGQWHLISLNSNCAEGGRCGSSSPQIRWLKADLAANKAKRCTLAYMHHPRFSSGEEHGSTPEVTPLWDALYAAGVDVVLSGHEHPRVRGGHRW
jgi:acid phosphatase type 7